MASKKNSKIAVILFTVTAYGDTPARAAMALRKISKIGYRKVQVSGSFNGINPGEMRRMADDNGLEIIGSHTDWNMFEEDLAQVIRRTHTWGAKHVSIPSFAPAPNENPRTGWQRFARKCNTVGRKLKQEGIQLQYHNHAFEFQKLGIRGGRGGTRAYEILMNGTDPALLQPELDLGWIARGGIDPAWCVAQLGRPMDQVHVKDWGVYRGQNPVWRAVGEGNLNWTAIIKACKKAKVQTYIVEQDDCPITKDPFKSLAISFENLVALGL